MVNQLIVLAAVTLLPMLLLFEKSKARRGLLPVKISLSLLFVITALVRPRPLPGYFGLILAGLFFCLAGDIFLALPQKKAFLSGLISFLLGHLFYIFGFFSLGGTSPLTGPGILVTLVAGMWVYAWLHSRLDGMRIPVIAYLAATSTMFVGAWTVLGHAGLPDSGRAAVFFGALFFYLSDLFTARDRFVKEAFVNRLLGLPLYFGGQFLIAFSIGMVG